MATGIRIDVVKPGSSAFAAGLKSGDVVLSVNGVNVTTPEEFRSVLTNLKPGERATLSVWRDEKVLSLEWEA